MNLRQTIRNCNGYNNINVLSWNIGWEMMTGRKSWAVAAGCTNSNPNECIKNVNKYLNSKSDLDLIALQEASRYQHINLGHMNLIHFRAISKTDMVIFYRKSRFNLIEQLTGHTFNNDRPFLIAILEDKITKDKICFINLHASHNTTYLNEIQTSINPKLNGKIYDRNIIAGDHNHDIGNGYKLNGMQIYAPNIKHITCCSPNSTWNKSYDHILDSYSIPVVTVDNNMKYDSGFVYSPAGDHLPISSSLPGKKTTITVPLVIKPIPSKVVDLSKINLSKKFYSQSSAIYGFIKFYCEVYNISFSNLTQVKISQDINFNNKFVLKFYLGTKVTIVGQCKIKHICENYKVNGSNMAKWGRRDTYKVIGYNFFGHSVDNC